MEKEKCMMQRSRFNIMTRLVGLVKPLTGHMVLAVMMGVLGHLCASFITVFGGYAVLSILRPEQPSNIHVLFASVLIFALIRGFLRYAEQACNHFIAFKLLALIRDKVFGALRRLCPAKLEGKDKGNLISIITSDIELLEVFYAHTISGGERQHLGLARAFLHDAPFMLLDEPTSNLDSLNEAVILKSLSEECSNKSVILVSHRKSTMGIADIVYTVEHGRVS